ncbi:MAG: glycosyltransferase family 4 protein [Bacteroidota bacterium]
MSKHILFVSSWYPSKGKKSHGIFFKRHAEAAALLHQISSIHVCSGSAYQIEVHEEQRVYSIIGTYKKVQHQIPILSNIQKLLRSLHCFKQCYRTLIEQQGVPSLVLLNVIFPAGIFVLWLHYVKKIPFIIQEQWSGYYPEDGNYRGFLTKIITSICVKLSRLVIVVSNKLEQSMKQHGLHNQYKRIGNVVDTELFVPISKKTDGPFRFVHVSTVNDKEKNITGIINAAYKLSQEKVNFIVDIIGDGPEREQFEQKSALLGLNGKIIHFHGYQEPAAVASFIGRSDCFILNSNYEGLPCVLLEAMSCGIPVISTRVGAVPEMMTDKQGIMIAVNDEQALANAMKQMMQNYHHYHSQEIRQYIVDHYSYPAISKVFDRLFDEALLT